MSSSFAKLNHLSSVFVDILRADVWIMDGLEVSTKQPLKIIIAASETQKNYIAKLAFNSNCKESYIGRKYFWHLCKLIKKNKYDCSLAIVEGDVLHRSLYENKNDFYTPLWLKSTVDIPLKATNKSAKDDLRIIRKFKLGYQITTDPVHLQDFYYNMYLPTVKQRHGDRTVAMEYAKMMQKVQEGKCILLLVKKQSTSIAGGVILTSGDLPRLWSNGLRDANPLYKKEGAIYATWYFSSKYLVKQGYKRMHVGLTRSFLRDGVLQYKKKWNNKIIDWDRKGFIIKPLHLSDSVKGFFVNNPFVHIHKDQPCGAIFIANNMQDSPKILEQFQSKYYIPGLSELDIYSINNACVRKRKVTQF